MEITIRAVAANEFLSLHKLNSRWMGIALNEQADAILALQFRVLVENFRDSCFVTEVEGKVIGLLIGFAAQADEETCYIHALAIAPEYRRCGIGRMLVNTFCNNMVRRGRKSVSLVTWPENPGSRSFYDAAGFRPVVSGKPIRIHGIEASRDYYGKGRHMVVYTKKL